MLPSSPLIRPPEPPVPTRLYEPETAPAMSPPAVCPATIVLVSVVVPPELNRPPPVLAVLPLTVQSVSVVVPLLSLNSPPPILAESPLTVQLVSVVVPPELARPPPVAEAVLP